MFKNIKNISSFVRIFLLRLSVYCVNKILISDITNSLRYIKISNNTGVPDDEMDNLEFNDNFEDPDKYESCMQQIHQDAEQDEELAATLKRTYLDSDRKQAFKRYLNSGVAAALSGLLERMGVNKQHEICDYGCGPGQLGWALSQLGYKKITLMDPNQYYYTGTGYVASVAGDSLEIINDINQWNKIRNRYDAIVSKGTIHHWQHIPLVSLGIRRAMKPGAFWFVMSEFYSNTPMALINSLNNHPFYNRYNTYEWPYPASAYVDLIQSVGFNLTCVIPQFYHNNEYVDYDLPPPLLSILRH